MNEWLKSKVGCSLLLALSAVACSPLNGEFSRVCSKMQSTVLINDYSLQVTNACTNEQVQTGLMNRQSLDMDTGMLFVFREQKTLNFWMKNTYIPLDIAFININHEIVDIRSMKPLDETPVSSRQPASYALEVTQGWFQARGIVPGMKVQIK